MNSLHITPSVLMHAAALISLSAMAFKDQLKLRFFLLFSIILSIAYHFNQDRGPAWGEIFWNAITFVVTLIVLIQLTLDRTHLGLSPEEEELFGTMDSLTPGEFRALLKVGVWKTALGDIGSGAESRHSHLRTGREFIRLGWLRAARMEVVRSFAFDGSAPSARAADNGQARGGGAGIPASIPIQHHRD